MNPLPMIGMMGSALGGMYGGGGDSNVGLPGFLSPEELRRQNSMQPFDWSNILKMFGSAYSSNSGGGLSEPTSNGMLPRNPSPIAPIMGQPSKGEGYYQTWLQKNNLG